MYRTLISHTQNIRPSSAADSPDLASGAREQKIIELNRYKKAPASEDAPAESAQYGRTDGKGGSPSELSLYQYADNYLKNYQRVTIRDVSYDRNLYILEELIAKSPLGRKPYAEITTDDVQKEIVRLAGHFSRSSVSKYKSFLSQVYNHALRTGDLRTNPIPAVELPSEEHYMVKKRPVECFSEEQRNLFRKELERRNDGSFSSNGKPGTYVYGQYRYLFLFICNTGLRTSEALALQWKDIDFDSGEMHIVRSGKWRKGEDGHLEWYETAPKTKSSVRSIPLNKEAFSSLLAFKGYNRTKDNMDHVFATKNGKIPSRGSLNRSLKSIEKRAGLPFASLHDLRHSFITAVGINTRNPEIVRQLSGHSSVRFTYATYVHPDDSAKRSAVRSLSFLNGPGHDSPDSQANRLSE